MFPNFLRKLLCDCDDDDVWNFESENSLKKQKKKKRNNTAVWALKTLYTMFIDFIVNNLVFDPDLSNKDQCKAIIVAKILERFRFAQFPTDDPESWGWKYKGRWRKATPSAYGGQAYSYAESAIGTSDVEVPTRNNNKRKNLCREQKMLFCLLNIFVMFVGCCWWLMSVLNVDSFRVFQDADIFCCSATVVIGRFRLHTM